MLERDWDDSTGAARNCRYRLKCDICRETYKEGKKKGFAPKEWTNNLEPILMASTYGWFVLNDGKAVCPSCLKRFERKPRGTKE